MEHRHHDGRACSCDHHRHAAPAPRREGFWPALLPVLACAVCPACLATYAKLLSVVGASAALPWARAGGGLSERQHALLLAACVVTSIGMGVRERRLTGRSGPLALTSLGCLMLVVAHLAEGDPSASGASWLGVALLLGGAVWGYRLRRALSARTPQVLGARPTP